MGSPLRLLDSKGATRGLYGYEEFGAEIDELAIQGNIVQPFTYTGYQKDNISGTCYAQAREYRPEAGRFISEDIVRGFAEYPFTQNHYVYCWNQPLVLVDDDGRFVHLLVGAGIGAVGGLVTRLVSDAVSGKRSSFSTYLGDIVGGAAGGAVLAQTGNLALASAVESGTSSGIKTLGDGIEDMVQGKQEVTWQNVGKLGLKTLTSTGVGAATGYTVGKVIGKVSKFIEKPMETLNKGVVKKVFEKTIYKAKTKVFNKLGLIGRNSWSSLTKQVYTKLKTGTWTISGLGSKTWGKMFGFEITDSAIDEIIKQGKEGISG